MGRISEEKVTEVADLLMSLSREEREAVLQKIGTCGNEIVPEQPLTMHSKVESERFKNGRVCPHCGGVHVQRNGHRKDGAQKFVCRDCGKSFVSTTNTAVKGTRKSPEVWDKFMKCMSENRSRRQHRGSGIGTWRTH